MKITNRAAPKRVGPKVSKRKAVSPAEIDVRKAFAKAWAGMAQGKASQETKDKAWLWYASGFLDGHAVAKAGFTEPRIRIVGKRRGQP